MHLLPAKQHTPKCVPTATAAGSSAVCGVINSAISTFPYAKPSIMPKLLQEMTAPCSLLAKQLVPRCVLSVGAAQT